MTCHNRCEVTDKCLKHLLEAARELQELTVRVVAVDDGSSDATWEVLNSFEFVDAVRGGGDLFWNGGMRKAMLIAMQDDPDYLLLLNDDVTLQEDSLTTLLTAALAMQESVVVVGSTTSLDGTAITYGGLKRTNHLHPFRYQLVSPSPALPEVDTFHGNCVLIPRPIYRDVGAISDDFSHAMGDTDYGLRVQSAGFRAIVAQKPVGACAKNPHPRPWLIESLGFGQMIGELTGPKGLPPSDWWHFTNRHGGPLWPLWFAAPYLAAMVRWAVGKLLGGPSK